MADITREELRQATVDVLDRVFERMDVEAAARNQQHSEHRQWMQQIHDEVKRTNGRTTRLEEQVRQLFAKLKEFSRGEAGGLKLKQVAQWVALCGGVYYVLTQVLGYHK